MEIFLKYQSLEVYCTINKCWTAVDTRNFQPQYSFDKFNYCDIFDGDDFDYVSEIIENSNESLTSLKYKGIPKDSSIYVRERFDFLTNEVCVCKDISYISLEEIINFDYSKILKLNDIKKHFLHFKTNKRKLISIRELINPNYFDILKKIESTFNIKDCRIVYFISCIDIEN